MMGWDKCLWGGVMRGGIEFEGWGTSEGVQTKHCRCRRVIVLTVTAGELGC
jgi:hypothetical protein